MLVIWGLSTVGLPSLILPAPSGFLVVGPLLAIGLYEKSRRLQAGQPVTLENMMVAHPRSGVGADLGRFRLTFRHAGRALRLTVNADGEMITRAMCPVGVPYGQSLPCQQ